MSNIVKHGDNEILSPDTFGKTLEMAKALCRSELLPVNFRGKPHDLLIAWQLGYELGISKMQSLRWVAVINGKPSLWGDGMLAVVLAHPDCEGVHEEEKKEGDLVVSARCIVKRRGRSEVVRDFSIEDAKKAQLWGKKGPWTQYPQRMLQMRARGFALRDSFADCLAGLKMAEEEADHAGDLPPQRHQRRMAEPIVAAAVEVEESAEFSEIVEEKIALIEEEIPGCTVLGSVVDYEDWLWKVEAANSPEELDLLAEEAKRLPEQHKVEAREHYKRAQLALGQDQ